MFESIEDRTLKIKPLKSNIKDGLVNVFSEVNFTEQHCIKNVSVNNNTDIILITIVATWIKTPPAKAGINR
eukprot:Awhi_evm1s3539